MSWGIFWSCRNISKAVELEGFKIHPMKSTRAELKQAENSSMPSPLLILVLFIMLERTPQNAECKSRVPSAFCLWPLKVYTPNQIFQKKKKDNLEEREMTLPPLGVTALRGTPSFKGQFFPQGVTLREEGAGGLWEH